MGLYTVYGPYPVFSLYTGYRLHTLYGPVSRLYTAVYRYTRDMGLPLYLAYIRYTPYMGPTPYLAYIQPMGLYRRYTPVFSLYLAYIRG